MAVEQNVLPPTVLPQYRSCEPRADQKTGMKGLGFEPGLLIECATERPAFCATFQCSILMGDPLPPGPWYGYLLGVSSLRGKRISL